MEKRDPPELMSPFHNPSDPTPLTTAQLLREIASLKELVLSKIEAIDKAITVAHDDLVRVPTDVQKQVGTLKDLHGALIEGIQKELVDRAEMWSRKFDGVDNKFADFDKKLADSHIFCSETSKVAATNTSKLESFKELMKTSSDERKTALDAALLAQKEASAQEARNAAQAVSKQEAATNKQIDALAELLRTSSKATEEKISDVKDRLIRFEGQGQGTKENESVRQTGFSNTALVVGIIASIAVGLIGIMAGLMR
jgi:hypothetical protein